VLDHHRRGSLGGTSGGVEDLLHRGVRCRPVQAAHEVAVVKQFVDAVFAPEQARTAGRTRCASCASPSSVSVLRVTTAAARAGLVGGQVREVKASPREHEPRSRQQGPSPCRTSTAPHA
jgi:hypothetical protein